MVTRPTVHPVSTTIAELGRFFADEHVHMALLVDRGRLVGTVERADLDPPLSGDQRASAVAKLHERVKASRRGFCTDTDVDIRRCLGRGADAPLP